MLSFHDTILNIKSLRTHRSKKLLHVRWIRVDDQFEDLFVPDFPQDLPVGSRTRLTNVHFSFHGRWGFHKILQFKQSCKTQKRDISSQQLLSHTGLHHCGSSLIRISLIFFVIKGRNFAAYDKCIFRISLRIFILNCEKNSGFIGLFLNFPNNVEKFS